MPYFPGVSPLTLDKNNVRVGISQTSPVGKLHVVKTPLTNVSNAHRDTSNSTIMLESNDAVLQLIADEAGISASGILLSQVPASGDNKHWLLSGMGPSRSNRLQICYGTTSSGGNVFGTIDLLTPILVISTGGNVGIGGITSPTALLHPAAGTTARAPLCLPHGSAPASPVNGDMWTTTAGLYVRINGATVGPLT